MRIRSPIRLALLPAILILVAGCGRDEGPAAGAGQRLETLARESARLAGQSTPPAGRAGGDESTPDPRVSDGDEKVGGVTAQEAAPSGESRPGLEYTRRYYAYRSARRRDPFEPLLAEGGAVDGITLSALTLTGILWDSAQSLVVLEDSRGRGYSLRVGDRLAGARLVAVRKDAAVFRVVEFGEARSVVKELFTAEEMPI